jgi:hypothetical protein
VKKGELLIWRKNGNSPHCASLPFIATAKKHSFHYCNLDKQKIGVSMSHSNHVIIGAKKINSK